MPIYYLPFIYIYICVCVQAFKRTHIVIINMWVPVAQLLWLFAVGTSQRDRERHPETQKRFSKPVKHHTYPFMANQHHKNDMDFVVKAQHLVLVWVQWCKYSKVQHYNFHYDSLQGDVEQKPTSLQQTIHPKLHK